jgi:glutamate racemase
MQPIIGVFDSGLGGFTVLKELQRIMPGARYLYYGDSLYAPYGPRTKSWIQSRSQRIVEYLLQQGAQLIVVACNTATASAIHYLRKQFPFPFVGMEPAVKPAALHTKSGVIGVLATKGTLMGDHYHQTKQQFAGSVKVLTQVGFQLVEMIERSSSLDVTLPLLHKYLTPMLEQGSDYIVLGCTHYPLLKSQIESIIKGRAIVVDPAMAVAKQTFRKLSNEQQNSVVQANENTTDITIISSKLTPAYQRIAKDLFPVVPIFQEDPLL